MKGARKEKKASVVVRSETGQRGEVNSQSFRKFSEPNHLSLLFRSEITRNNRNDPKHTAGHYSIMQLSNRSTILVKRSTNIDECNGKVQTVTSLI